MSNCVHIIGHLGSDPVTRVTAKGVKITTFSAASNYREAGEEVTIWWRITIWGDQFDYLLPYLRKGSAVFVTGKLKKPELYDDKEGNKRISLPVTATSIDFLPTGRAERTQAEQQVGAPHAPGSANNNYSAAGYQQKQQRPFAETPYSPLPASTQNRPSFTSAYGAAMHSDSDADANEEAPF